MFFVADATATARWYEANLGFGIAGHFPDAEPWEYVSLMRGAAEIMLLRLPGFQKAEVASTRRAGGWDAYLRTDGVAALFRSLEGRDFIRSPMKRMPYQDWEFEVRDPNGYILVFGGAQ